MQVPPEVLEQVRQEHPRFDALVATHGQPLAPQTDEGGASLSRDVVRLMLRSNASASATQVCATRDVLPARALALNSAGLQAPTERRLLLSMTVAEVKTLCGRLFALEPARQRLFFKDGKVGHACASARARAAAQPASLMRGLRGRTARSPSRWTATRRRWPTMAWWEARTGRLSWRSMVRAACVCGGGLPARAAALTHIDSCVRSRRCI